MTRDVLSFKRGSLLDIFTISKNLRHKHEAGTKKIVRFALNLGVSRRNLSLLSLYQANNAVSSNSQQEGAVNGRTHNRAAFQCRFSIEVSSLHLRQPALASFFSLMKRKT